MKSQDLATLLSVPDMPAYLRQVEEKLIASTNTDNPSLQKPVLRLIHARSKRLRSMLVIAAATSQGRPVDETVIAGCAAIELVHIGSLVHDDIIDNASTRWSVPTVNSQEGTDHAILVGDYLFAKAGVVGATISAKAAALVSATIAALIDGESREVADQFNTERSIDSLLAAINGKTAALFSAACQMGALCARLDQRRALALAKYGTAFGMAFQLLDDVLDFVSTEELLGKPVGNDVREGVYTLPILLALKSPQGQKLRPLLAHPKRTGYDPVQILLESGAVEQTIIEIHGYNQRTVAELQPIDNSSGLAELPGAYSKWALTNLVDTSHRAEVMQFLHNL